LNLNSVHDCACVRVMAVVCVCVRVCAGFSVGVCTISNPLSATVTSVEAVAVGPAYRVAVLQVLTACWSIQRALQLSLSADIGRSYAKAALAPIMHCVQTAAGAGWHSVILWPNKRKSLRK
jgi:hypothetical protein